MTGIGNYLIATLLSVCITCLSLIGRIFGGGDSSLAADALKTGGLWGHAMGDYALKAHIDAFVRGGATPYSGKGANEDDFAFRIIYRGYGDMISRPPSARWLPAAGDNGIYCRAAANITTSGHSGHIVNNLG